MAGVEWPEWWEWEFESSAHVLERMIDRQFSEADLRLMLEEASGYHADVEDGRWVIETGNQGRPWFVIVEPLVDEAIVVIVTAFLVG